MRDLEPSLGCRRFLVTEADQLYRLANTRFDRMLRDPASYPLPAFAGLRVRMADLVVELINRVPVRVVRECYAMLTFDHRGCMDLDAFGRQQTALVDTALAKTFTASKKRGNIIDASARFKAQGGTWAPSRQLARTIQEAALGRQPCARL